MSQILNPAGNIYRTEYYYSVKRVLCRNSFHHYTEIPGAGAQFINQMVLAKMIIYILGIQSVEVVPIQLLTSLVTGNFQDSYQYLFEGGAGGIAASPADARLGAYVKIETDHPARDHYTGGCFIAGIPQNWTMEAPVFHEEGQRRYREIFKMFVDTMGKENNAATVKWVIFSRTLFKANPEDIHFWSQRVSHIGVRRWLMTLRTRRPKPTI